MRATPLLLSAALTLCAAPAFAQTSYNRVVEPVSPSVDAIIHAPIEYNENGVVKAQHFNADNLTEEEYQAVLAEADRIRSYRDANGMNFESDYITVDAPSYVAPTTVTSTANSPSYQIELFAPETPSYATSSYETAASTTSSAAKWHVISKGDTLYNLSKRYDTTVARRLTKVLFPLMSSSPRRNSQRRKWRRLFQQKRPMRFCQRTRSIKFRVSPALT